MQVKLIGGRRNGQTFQMTHLVPEISFPVQLIMTVETPGWIRADREVYRLASEATAEYHFDRVERVHKAHRSTGEKMMSTEAKEWTPEKGEVEHIKLTEAQAKSEPPQWFKAKQKQTEVINRIFAWCKQLETRLIEAAIAEKVISYKDESGAVQADPVNGIASYKLNGTYRITFEIGPFYTEAFPEKPAAGTEPDDTASDRGDGNPYS